MKHLWAVPAVLVAVAAPTAAQSTTEYRAPEGPIYWVSDNPFHLYLTRDGQTVGDTIRAISVFREDWLPIDSGYDVVRTTVDAGFGIRRDVDTTTITRRGRVVRINGQTDYNKGEWDAMLKLPAAPLRVGLEWSDTLAHPTDGPAGDGLYEVRRSYRVTGQLTGPDSAGFEIASTGTIRFNMSMWMDSTAGQYRWFELEGPVDEWYVFDPATGQLHRRRWAMKLVGSGGDFDGTRSDTVPAALDSRNSRYRIPETRAAALMAPLPGQDSTFSIGNDGVVRFGHTMGRTATRLVEGFRRADGLMGIADVELEEEGATRWTFAWVGLQEDPRTMTFEARGDSLITREGRAAPPVDEWGIAEHGMLGTLVPSLQELPDGQQVPFAIYRPTPGSWDVVQVTTRRLPELSLFMIQTEQGAQTAVIVDANGLLLLEETARPDGSRITRVPTSEARQRQVQEAIATLQGGS